MQRVGPGRGGVVDGQLSSPVWVRRGRVKMMRDAFDRDRELWLLGDLCRELARVGVNVIMSDARPAVLVPVGASKLGLSVLVNGSSNLFTWGDEHTHEVSDRAGAAAAIVAYVRQVEAAAGRPSPGASTSRPVDGGS